MSDQNLSAEHQALLERMSEVSHELLQDINAAKNELASTLQSDGAAILRDAELQVLDALKAVPGTFASKSGNVFSVRVRRHTVECGVSVDVFSVELLMNEFVWPETIPSEESLKWLLQGMKMMFSIGGGFFPHVEIPRDATSRFVEEEESE
ncbi:MAG: hypothetical protein JWL80_9 [Parcubacteria group bacterium]|nr:hypothetical protein [Parcubacteria group bacterium]